MQPQPILLNKNNTVITRMVSRECEEVSFQTPVTTVEHPKTNEELILGERWGCFDESNRLEERMLSAVLQQVQTIQKTLKSQIEGREIRKQRLCVWNWSLAITTLDRQQIAHVILFRLKDQAWKVYDEECLVYQEGDDEQGGAWQEIVI
ncbi:hypothetical protein KQX54_016108 [Cotesia glomerata]|uniref:Dynein heavy chain hydrolytic ATP-binding dynein motor region domain-containing protein n=1 Tax=Cotesia glomerata TaxID=32391 RepID=A0AAV7J5B1_COTGL|nr:hypothetical protein KQX54_016108 [Cotesia glomerata]